MKLTGEKIEISPDKVIYRERVIPWQEVAEIKLLGQELALVLKTGERVKISAIRQSAIDALFHAYKEFIKKRK